MKISWMRLRYALMAVCGLRGAVIILSVFALLTLWFRRWQSGSLY